MAELIVITGGACSGKTSIIEALAARGHRTLPESAYEVISELNDAHGVARQIAWRRANQAAFQAAVTRRQHARERAAARFDGPVFCDRAVPDGHAYCRLAGIPWPEDLRALAAECRYAHVFLLATLSEFDGRRETGRVDTREESVRVATLLEELYRPRSGRLTHVAEAPIEDRIDLILGESGMAP